MSEIKILEFISRIGIFFEVWKFEVDWWVCMVVFEIYLCFCKEFIGLDKYVFFVILYIIWRIFDNFNNR